MQNHNANNQFKIINKIRHTLKIQIFYLDFGSDYELANLVL